MQEVAVVVMVRLLLMLLGAADVNTVGWRWSQENLDSCIWALASELGARVYTNCQVWRCVSGVLGYLCQAR